MTPYVSHSDVLAAFPDVLVGRKPIRVDSQGRWGWGWTCHRCCVIGVCYADHASALAAAFDHCREAYIAAADGAYVHLTKED